MSNANYCDKIGAALHYGQTRRGGGDYITHTRAVCQIARDAVLANKDKLGLINDQLDMISCIALLHDVMEDTGLTRSQMAVILEVKIESIRFVNELLDNLEILTHAKGETYEYYIDWIIAKSDEFPLALIVKIADMQHNMSCCMAELRESCNPKSSKQLEKYSKHYNRLVEAFDALV